MQEHRPFDDEDQGQESKQQEKPDERAGVEGEGEAAHWGLAGLDDDWRRVASLLSAVD